MAEPRGYRLNNPLNIRRTATAWVGLAVRQADAEFCAFELPEYGIRAAAKILQTYQEKHGIGTLRGVVSRWAPPEDNNDTSAYITAVSIWAGIEPDEQISLSDYAVVLPMLRAMCRVELGKPADGERWYDVATWKGSSPGWPGAEQTTEPIPHNKGCCDGRRRNRYVDRRADRHIQHPAGGRESAADGAHQPDRTADGRRGAADFAWWRTVRGMGAAR